MNKSIISLSIIVLLLGGILPVVEVLATLKTITVFIDGEQKNFHQEPVIKNARILVPMRGIFESLGARVEYDSKKKKVVAKNNDFSIELVIGDVYALVNEQRVKLDQRAEVINGRTLVPLRFISESLGAQVHWDGEGRIVTIRYRTIGPNEKLLVAIRENNNEVVEKLLKEGADPNAVSAHNEKALELAIKNRSTSITSLLLEYGADPNQTLQSGLPLLVVAVDQRNIENTQALLDAGANPDSQFIYQNYTRSAMNSASSEIRGFSVDRDSDFVELLMKNGATPPKDWPWKDQIQEQGDKLSSFSIPNGEATEGWGVYKLNEYTGDWELVPTYAIDSQTLQAYIDVWNYKVHKIIDLVPAHMKKSWAIKEFNLFANMKAITFNLEYKHKDPITLDEVLSILEKVSTRQTYEQILNTIEMNNMKKQHVSKQELVVMANHLLREQLTEYHKSEGITKKEELVKLNDHLDLLCTFIDKDDIFYHYEKELAIAVNYNLLTGHTGHFILPNHLVTREEAVSLLARYLTFYWKINEWH